MRFLLAKPRWLALVVVATTTLPATLASFARAGDDAAPAGALARLGQGWEALRAADADKAVRVLDGVAERAPRVADYARYLSAEAAFYSDAFERARRLYDQVAGDKRSRFALVARFRAADALWAQGGAARVEAVRRYRALVGKTTAKNTSPAAHAAIDPIVARFRIAESAPAHEASVLFRAIYVDAPAHPLAEEAARRLGAPSADHAAPAAAAPSPAERIHRADTLSESREWQAALDELAKVPATLPDPLGAERDYVLGMTKYRMRRDYGRAAELLLQAAPRLGGERAAAAAFHGARALSRADRDDEAIAGYERVVATYPRSRWAAEAQFRSGWLDFNRGRFAQGLPRLEATLARFPKSEFGTDAAWIIAFSHYLLGHADAALDALDEFARRSRGPYAKSGIDAPGRFDYFRARTLGKLGRADDERVGLAALATRAPLSYYGLIARARLQALGAAPPFTLPPARADLPAASARAISDPAVARADDLASAGLAPEAGVELARDESALLGRLGKDNGLAILLDRYPRFFNFHRAYQLAESRGDAALATQPEGAARVFWQAAYPLAYHALIDEYGPPAGNPDHFLFAIMRKESGFFPNDVSYADARGLLQMIPPTSVRVAAKLGRAFAGDELYEPNTNIELGAAYIGALNRKFKNQPLLTAGAFNAGPRAMMRWCDLHGTHPLDELVELVTFEQTREYIKRVAAIYARYRYLYAHEVFVPKLDVDCHYERSGPDY